MGGKAPQPVMRRLPCGCAHPLLIDRLLHVQAGADDTETLQRIAEACASAGIELERAVAFVAPAGDLQNQPHGGDHGDS